MSPDFAGEVAPRISESAMALVFNEAHRWLFTKIVVVFWLLVLRSQRNLWFVFNFWLCSSCKFMDNKEEQLVERLILWKVTGSNHVEAEFSLRLRIVFVAERLSYFFFTQMGNGVLTSGSLRFVEIINNKDIVSNFSSRGIWCAVTVTATDWLSDSTFQRPDSSMGTSECGVALLNRP